MTVGVLSEASSTALENVLVLQDRKVKWYLRVAIHPFTLVRSI